MNPLPEGIDPDSKVTAGSFRQNGNLLANASCEESRGGTGAKDGVLLDCHKKVEAVSGETPVWSINSVVRG